ncbi:hypothetical protein L484_024342 [Morus notabilis]|uniref:Uncharacterized protein n=1 Tax=Morus notabilis TaxID=981085 RepID=W9S7M2_9ROSA|nr:hypothetical protein L484_024342 [Morus notabilis]
MLHHVSIALDGDPTTLCSLSHMEFSTASIAMRYRRGKVYLKRFQNFSPLRYYQEPTSSFGTSMIHHRAYT